MNHRTGISNEPPIPPSAGVIPGGGTVTESGHCFARIDWWAFWVAFMVALGVYFYTMAPTVTLEDSGEFAVAGDYLGVPHPPGYPLWTMCAWLFRTIFQAEFRGQPNPAWGMNLLSAVFGALTAAITAMLLSRSGRDVLAWLARHQRDVDPATLRWISWTGGVAASLIFAFSPANWSQALIVEVYSMNAFFQALLFLYIYMWICQPRRRWLYLAGLVFGLGLTNHQTLLLIAAALVVILMLKDRALFRDFALTALPYLMVVLAIRAGALPMISHPLAPSMYVYLFLNFLVLLLSCYLLPNGRTIALTFLFIQLGLAVYIYMPIASEFNPPMNWGYPRTWEGFKHALTRGQYEKIIPADVFAPQFLRQIGDFFADLRSQFTLPLALLGFLPFTAWHVTVGGRRIRLRRIAIGLSLAAVLMIVAEEALAGPGIEIAALTLTYRGLILLIMLLAAAGGLLLVVLEGREWVNILRHYRRPENTWTDIGVAALTLCGALVIYAYIAMQILANAVVNPHLPWNLRMFWVLLVVAVPLLTAVAAVGIGDRRINADMDLNADSRKWMLTIIAGFMVMGVFLVMLANPKGDLQDAFIQRVKWIAAHGLYAFWVGYGLMFALVVFREWLPRWLPAAPVRWVTAAACAAALLSPGILILNNAYNEELIRTIGGVEQRGHDFGWQFGNYQLRGAEAIIEELGDPDGPIIRVRGLPDWLVNQPLTPWYQPLPNPEYPPAMGTNAVFFGGTDPGRFVPTYMIYSARVRPDVYLITQNALADNTYLNVMRDLYGDDIFIPSAADANVAFRQYVEDVREGRQPRTAAIIVDGDRVSVQGVQGVMIINGILARMIFDMNKAKHDFYIEESYVIEWMYPYLTPHGLIMKINAEQLPQLPPEIVKDDLDFWAWYVRRLTADQRFLRDVVARKSFSKLRSAIAGLYVFRNLFVEAEQAFREALELYPLSPEANFRLADLYLRQGRAHDAILLMEAFYEQDPGNDRILPFIGEVRHRVDLNRQRQELEQALQSGSAEIRQALELAEIYHQLGNPTAFAGLMHNLIGDNSLPPPVIRELAQSLRAKGHFELLELALMRYVERIPGDQTALLDLAEARVALRKYDDALRALETAVRIGPAVRETLRHDRRFAPMHNHPRFRRLLGMP